MKFVMRILSFILSLLLVLNTLGANILIKAEIEHTTQSSTTLEALVPNNSDETKPTIKLQETDQTKIAEHNQQLESVLVTEDAPLVNASELTALQRLELLNLPTGEAHLAYRSSTDNSVIKKLTATWLTKDSFSESDNDSNLLSLKWDDANDKEVQMKVEFALSGEQDYAPGTFSLTIPKYIFKDRMGNSIGKLKLSVPAAPDMSQLFAYTEEEDCFKLVNTRALKAASAGNFEFSIAELKPYEVKDYITNYKTDEFNAKLSIKSNNGEFQETSNSLTARVDTAATLETVTKLADKVYEKWPDYFPYQLVPENSNNYIFTKWTIFARTKASQTFTVKFKDEPSSEGNDTKPKVIILGYQTADGSVQKCEDNNLSALEGEIFQGYVKDGENFHTCIYLAYPKKDFEDAKTYKLKNKVSFTLTSNDDKVATTKEDNATLNYTPISFPMPKGQFYVNKYGYGKNLAKRENKDEGIYEGALNSLKDGKDTEITYKIQARGFGMPFTLESNDSKDAKDIKSYGKKSYKMEVTDNKVHFEDFNAELKAGEDFYFNKIQFAVPEIYNYEKFTTAAWGYKENVTNDKTVISHAYIQRGEWGYQQDNAKNAEIPTLKVSIQHKDSQGFQDYATVSCVNGKLSFSEHTNKHNDSVLDLPNDTIAYKVTAETKKAALIWNMYPTVVIKASKTVKEKVNNLFQNSNVPVTRIKNFASLHVYFARDNTDKFINEDFACNILKGIGYGARLKKQLVQHENDPTRNLIKLKYSIKAIVQSNVTDLAQLNNFIKEGLIDEQRDATWYDLLPKGVNVVKNSIKLRAKDSVKSIETFPNYQGSSRTLLVVKADLKPQYKYLTNDDNILAYSSYGDVPELSFNAIYTWDKYQEFGSNLVNYAVYESNNKRLGTIKDFIGEADDPNGKNNADSQSIANDSELLVNNTNVLKGLNKASTNSNPTFIYAKTNDEVVVNTSSAAGLIKRVDVNNENWFSDGRQEDSARNVYEGGIYTYRLASKNANNQSTGIKFFDELESCVPDENSDDKADATFKGKFVDLDLTDAKKLGIKPVVYYSTKKNLHLNNANKDNTDLTNHEVWQTSAPEDKATITAIAIDCSKTTNDNDFVLGANQSLAVNIKMQAPFVKDLQSGTNDKAKYYDTTLKKNETEEGLTGGAHAYNGVKLLFKPISDGQVSDELATYFKYTKVGLKKHSVFVKKTWEDEDDLECLRPESLNVTLVADQKDTEHKTTLNASNNWQHEFTDLPYLNDKGEKITYSIKEEVPQGYRVKFLAAKEVENGVELNLVNEHETEKLSISGEKTWLDDNGNHPESIKLALLADGKQIQTKELRANNAGKWKYSFANLPMYRKDSNKKEKVKIAYTVKELAVPATYEVSYNKVNNDNKDSNEIINIVNRYNPYGNLTITKKLLNQPKNAKEPTFTFVCKFFNEEGKADYSIYDYEIFAKDNNSLKKAKISSNNTVQLQKDQSLKIKKIPLNYKYEIEEVKQAGYSIERAKSGAMSGQIDRDTQVEIVNDYTARGEIFIKGQKTLTGKALAANQFIFDVYSKDTQGKETLYVSASNLLDGSIPFGYFRYTLFDANKTFHYIVKERQANQPGYTYDNNALEFSIEVKDNGDGTLTLTPTYPEAGLSFKNEYHAKGSVQLVAYKQFQDKSQPKVASQFNFELYDFADKDKKVVAKASNDKDGVINFGPIEYTEKDIGKTYTYRAREVKGQDDSYEYDEHECEYQVTVKDHEDGTLQFDIKTKDLYTEDNKNAENLPLFVNKQKPGQLTLTKQYASDDKVDYSKLQNKYFKFKIKFDNLNEADKNRKFDLERTNITAKSTTLANARESVLSSVKDTLLTKIKDILGIKEKEVPAETVKPTSAKPILTMPKLNLDTNKTNNKEDDNKEQDNKKQENKEQENKELTNKTLAFNKAASVFFAQNLSSLRVASSIVKEGTCAKEEGALWQLDSEGNLVIKPNNGFGRIDKNIEYMLGEEFDKTKIKTISIEKGCYTDFSSRPNVEGKYYEDGYFFEFTKLEKVTIKDGKFFKGFRTFRGMFKNDSSLKSIEFPTENISEIAKASSMENMFASCHALTKLDLSAFATSNVTNMHAMFQLCRELESIKFGANFKTANVTTMERMFQECYKLQSLDLSTFNTSQVTTMQAMFWACKALTGITFGDNFKTDNVNNMQAMFCECEKLTEINLQNFATSNVTDMNEMFKKCKALTSLDLSSFATSKVTNMHSMFNDCEKLASLTLGANFKADKATQMWSMFHGCTELQELDLSMFNTQEAQNMENMFSTCTKLTKIIFGENNAEKVEKMQGMFYKCNNLKELDLSNFSTANITNIKDMFNECKALEKLDLSKFATSKVTTMEGVFSYCENLQSITFSNNWTTSKVTTFKEMFNGCKMLEKLDLSSWTINDNANTENMLRLGADFKLNSINLGKGIKTLANSNLPNPKENMTTDAGISTGKWIKNDKTVKEAYTGADLTNSWKDNVNSFAGTWIWEYQKKEYEIKFAKNDKNATGEMASSKVKEDEDYVIPDCNFVNINKRFVGWTKDENGQGDLYLPLKKVKNLAKGNESITLYAKWETLATEAVIKDNSIEVDVKANEKLTVKGIPTGVKYSIYEETPSGWVLVSKKNESGEILANKEAQAEFVNSFNPKKAVAHIGGKKLLDKKEAGGFKFQLIDANANANNKVLGEATSNAAGMFSFAEITYDKVGKYNYQIKEIVDESKKNFITYDNKVIDVTCTVEMDENGNLKATLDKEAEQIVFNNQTKKAALTIKKEVTGTSKTDTPFTIEVAFAGVAQSFTLKNNETKTFSNLPIGTKYEVKELNIPSGYDLVEISNATGTIGEKGVTVTVKNNYKLTGSVDISLEKELKDAKGKAKELQGGEFEFILLDNENKTLATAKNDKEGKINFGSIKLTKAGTFNWQAKEVKGNDPNITYDDSEIKIEVKAEDKGDGTLTTTVTYPNGKKFTNKKIPPKPKEKGSFTIHKEVKFANGGTLSEASQQKAFKVKISLKILDPKTNKLVDLEGQYDFTATKQQNGFVKNGSEISLKHDETITVNNLPLGTEVSVTESDASGYTLDKDNSVLTGKIEAIKLANDTIPINSNAEAANNTDKEDKDEKVEGEKIQSDKAENADNLEKLAEKVKTNNEEQVDKKEKSDSTSPNKQNSKIATLDLKLVNIYDAKGALKLKGNKSVIAHKVLADAFNFLVLENNEIVQRVTNDKDGNIKFTDISYTLADVGKSHTYTIMEEHGYDQKYIYDKRQYTLTIKVEDDGKGKLIPQLQKNSASASELNFINRYRHNLPTTGKENLIIASVIGGALLLLALYLAKRKSK